MKRYLLTALLLAGCGADNPGMLVIHPDGTTLQIEDCKTGCNAPTPDETHPISEAELEAALAEIAAAPVGAETMGLDTLLFHGKHTLALLEEHGHGPLPAEHAAWLDRELHRQEVQIAFRLIDEDGVVRGEVNEQIPLKIKQHLVLKGTGALKRIEVTGKTKRVGLDHLWSRW